MKAIITAAPTCIHAQQHSDRVPCLPVAIVPTDVCAAAREWRSTHWHEIPDVADGYSDPLPRDSQLYAWMLDAYRAATAAESDEPGALTPGRLVWLRTPDYAPPRWIANPAYAEWHGRFKALDPAVPEQLTERMAMLEAPDQPRMGHWEERRGDLLGFLTLDGYGSLSFCS